MSAATGLFGLTRRQILGITAAIGAITAVGSALSLGMPLLAIVLENRGVGTSAIGVNTAMAGIASLVSGPFVPRIAARFGAARVLLASLLIATVCFPFFYVFDAFWVWFLLRLVFHSAINTAFILSEFWINALAPPDRRGLLMGIYGTVLSIGFAVGPLVLALVGSDGWAPFVVGTAVLALSLLPVLAALEADPPMEGEHQGSIFRYLALVPLATFAAFTMGSVESGLLSFLPIYGLRLGYAEATAALLVTSLAIGNIVSQVPLGLLADRIDKRKLLLGLAVVGGVAAVGLPAVAGSVAGLVLALMTIGGVTAGLYTVGLTHLGARLRGAQLASANAAFVFMYAVGMLVGPAGMGAGLDVWEPHGLAVVVAVLLLGYAALAAVRIRRAGPMEAEREPDLP